MTEAGKMDEDEYRRTDEQRKAQEIYRTIATPLGITGGTRRDWKKIGYAALAVGLGPAALADVVIRDVRGREKHGDLEMMLGGVAMTLAIPILVPFSLGTIVDEMMHPSGARYMMTNTDILRREPDASCAALYFGEDAKAGPARFSSLSLRFHDGTELSGNGISLYPSVLYADASYFIPLEREIHEEVRRLRDWNKEKNT